MGVTQYEPLELNAYIGTGSPWDLDGITGGAFVFRHMLKGNVANGIPGPQMPFTRIFILSNNTTRIISLVLSGDHIYKMDYSQMIEAHEDNKADATIAVIEVPMEEASRFGIMNTDETLRIKNLRRNPKAKKQHGLYGRVCVSAGKKYVNTWLRTPRMKIEQ